MNTVIISTILQNAVCLLGLLNNIKVVPSTTKTPEL